MEALTLHESVPGHHLQIALAQELEGVPEFRRYGGYTAFVEGWALYAESLGDELGFYNDPYSKFGQLTYEMWRAVRLVVDTGMHQFGLEPPAGDRLLHGERRQDRARHHQRGRPLHRLARPGARLQDRRAQDQGAPRVRPEPSSAPKFDVREFHDQVLGNGALPLDVLDARIDAWVASRKGRA